MLCSHAAGVACVISVLAPAVVRAQQNEGHATILHLLGLDHEALTDRFNGRDMRLTDVHGRVINEILA